jgi:hypothetical protein
VKGSPIDGDGIDLSLPAPGDIAGDVSVPSFALHASKRDGRIWWEAPQPTSAIHALSNAETSRKALSRSTGAVTKAVTGAEKLERSWSRRATSGGTAEARDDQIGGLRSAATTRDRRSA